MKLTVTFNPFELSSVTKAYFYEATIVVTLYIITFYLKPLLKHNCFKKSIFPVAAAVNT